MTIEEQLETFYTGIRESQDNSTIPAEEAIGRINAARRRIALKTKFYNFTDKVTAAGKETYFILKSDFHPAPVKEWASCNGRPIKIYGKADWTSRVLGYGAGTADKIGMLDGNTFYFHPPAQSNDLFEWKGYGVPPKLPGITGPDEYTTDAQAEACALWAAIRTLEDKGETPGPILMADYKETMSQVKARANINNGARLENEPADC